MPKSTFTEDYARLTRHLREVREASGMTQEQLAQKLDQGQSFVSKFERGERRLDVIELNEVCNAIGISLIDFLQEIRLRS